MGNQVCRFVFSQINFLLTERAARHTTKTSPNSPIMRSGRVVARRVETHGEWQCAFPQLEEGALHTPMRSLPNGRERKAAATVLSSVEESTLAGNKISNVPYRNLWVCPNGQSRGSSGLWTRKDARDVTRRVETHGECQCAFLQLEENTLRTPMCFLPVGRERKGQATE